MSNEQKVNILSSVLGNYIHSGKEILFSCPACKHHKKKLSVNLEKDKFKCWVCDFSGSSLRRLVRRYGNSSHKQEWYKIDQRIDLTEEFDTNFFDKKEIIETKIDLPPEFVSLCNKPTTASLIPIGYLKKRGLDASDILKWKIGYCSHGEHEGRIVVPSFSSDGRPNYFISRRYMESVFPKYKNPPASKDVIFNELYLDFDEDLIITEGVFDAIVAGTNAVPILGSILSERSRLFQKIVLYDTTVFMALDPDAEEKENKIIESLLKYGIEVYKIDVSPYKDVGEMPKKEFQERKKNAQLVDNENYFIYRTLHV